MLRKPVMCGTLSLQATCENFRQLKGVGDNVGKNFFVFVYRAERMEC